MHYVPPTRISVPVSPKTLKGLMLLAAWLAAKDPPKGVRR